MANFTVGDNLDMIMPLFDPAPVVGAVITVTSYTGPSGAMSTGLITISYEGDGIYKLSSEPVTLPGTYIMVAEAAVPAPNDVPFVGVFDVDPAWTFTLPVTVANGTTRKQFRRDVLRVFGDLIVATATTNGSTTTFLDATNFVLESGSYAARYALFTGGTAANLGKIRFVEKSSRSNFGIEFSQALPSATQAGDELELINSFGQGVKFDDVHAALDRAMRIAQDEAMIPIIAVVAAAFDVDTRQILVPATIVMVEDVMWQDPNSLQWTPVEHANTLGQNGWFMDDVNHSIYLNGPSGRWLGDAMLKVYGLGIPPLLEDDDDVSQVNPEWVTAQCLADLTGNLVTRGPRADRWYGAHMEFKAEAARLRPTLMPNLSPSARRFR